MKVEVWTLISMYDKCEYDENAVRKKQILYTSIRKHMQNFSQYDCHCKRLQEYAKNIFKDEKDVLKPETILWKNHQDSKCVHTELINHINCSEGRVIVNFQITFVLISIAQWVTLIDWGFTLITVTPKLAVGQ